ncbi:flavin oxidoreductase [Streptomyces lucensis JCM 4490]|uniref:Flavin oxidoreductase n=1 Tax=Streptomyces lucensis JCM 4490 TaxID=1306176 RepID=A0A918IU63_9ACTN|nr:flavin reductase family protein [Streptomyces lucensis]GGW32263.1 flavin oxidoreductase [Streptomyces lucensis JCM 4490]
MTTAPGSAVAAGDGPGATQRRAAPAGPGARALREVLGRYATGVTVVTCGPLHAPTGVTVNSFTSVSLNPPLILWCLARSSRSREAFTTAEYFAVNVLAAGQRDLATRFSGPADRFQGLTPRPGPRGEPLLPGAAAVLCCRRTAVVPAGDHLVFLGAVEHHARTADRTLLFADGAYHEGPPPPLPPGGARPG